MNFLNFIINLLPMQYIRNTLNNIAPGYNLPKKLYVICIADIFFDFIVIFIITKGEFGSLINYNDSFTTNIIHFIYIKTSIILLLCMLLGISKQ
jgi:hypothetical protein